MELSCRLTVYKWRAMQVTSLMVSEDERAESTNVFTVLNATDAEGNNSG